MIIQGGDRYNWLTFFITTSETLDVALTKPF